jgi:hypothetical protein
VKDLRAVLGKKLNTSLTKWYFIRAEGLDNLQIMSRRKFFVEVTARPSYCGIKTALKTIREYPDLTPLFNSSETVGKVAQERVYRGV